MSQGLLIYAIEAEEFAELWGSRDEIEFQKLIAEYSEFQEDEDPRNRAHLDPDCPTMSQALREILDGRTTSEHAEPYRQALWILAKAQGTTIDELVPLINLPRMTREALAARGVFDLVSIINADTSEPLPLPIPVSEDSPVSFLEASKVLEAYSKLEHLDIFGVDKRVAADLIRIRGWITAAACRGESMLFFVN